MGLKDWQHNQKGKKSGETYDETSAARFSASYLVPQLGKRSKGIQRRIRGQVMGYSTTARASGDAGNSASTKTWKPNEACEEPVERIHAALFGSGEKLPQGLASRTSTRAWAE